MEEQEVAVAENTEDAPSSQGNENVINGVEYQRDHDGNYLINGVPVMDAKQVPFYNRTREADRKIADAEKSLLQLQAQKAANVETAPEPQHDPEDIVPGMTMTYAEYDKIMADAKAQVMADLGQSQAGTTEQMARIEQDRQLQAAKQKFGDFFKNDAFVDELNSQLAGCTPQMIVQNPQLVEQGVALIYGAHIDEIRRAAEEKGRKSGKEAREIVEEVQLGKPGGPNGTRKVPVNDDIRLIAKQCDVSLEAAAEIWESRKKNGKDGN